MFTLYSVSLRELTRWSIRLSLASLGATVGLSSFCQASIRFGGGLGFGGCCTPSGVYAKHHPLTVGKFEAPSLFLRIPVGFVVAHHVTLV